jgi:DnaK suppressor protein
MRTRSTARALSRAQTRDLERSLRAEQARLERSIASSDGLQEAARSPTDGLRIPNLADGGLTAALQSRTLARREVVVDALRRLESGRYGLCVSCHEPIPYQRLMVMPEATHCVTCGFRT